VNCIEVLFSALVVSEWVTEVSEEEEEEEEEPFRESAMKGFVSLSDV